MKHNDYNNRGLSGIVNFGNTCYINSAIQSLSHTLDLTDFFISKKYQDKIKTKPESNNIEFINQWYRLLKGLWDDNCTISPKSFLKILIKICNEKDIDLGISENMQNDIHEFLILVLGIIHDTLSEKKKFRSLRNLNGLELESEKSWKEFFGNDYSKIIELFYGQILTEIKDKENGKIYSNTFQPLCFIPLPLKRIDNCSIYDCIDLYLEKEILDLHKISDDEYKSVTKQIIFYRLPKIIIFTLNRFNNKNIKLDDNIDIPDTLDMSKYNKNNSVYELYSICNHYGGSGGGHYTSLCKNNNIWYEFNDSSVRKLSEIDKSNAYCVFYKRSEE